MSSNMANTGHSSISFSVRLISATTGSVETLGRASISITFALTAFLLSRLMISL
jgi:hypothetical protein